MALLKIKCPECNAGLKSPTGFPIGQTVCCPKCETYFAVEEPEEEAEEADEAPKKAAATIKGKPAGKAASAKKPLKAAVADDEEDDEEEEAPKKKKKKKAVDDDDESTGSYKNSPLRFVILGVLVVVMLGLGYMLYEKRKKERETAEVPPAPSDGAGPGAIPPPPGGLNPIRPGGVRPVGIPPKKQPGGGANVGFDPTGGLLGGGGSQTPAEAQALLQKYRTALVGTWTADLGNGSALELTYTATGAYRANQTGPKAGTVNGKYTVLGLVGTKGLKIHLETGAGAQTISAIFDGPELEHPALEAGLVGTFRKK